MSNSNIRKVAVITQYNSRSLHDHLSSAKWWDLDRKKGGLYIFTPFLSDDNSFWYRGVADSIYQNIDFLKNSNEPYVIFTSGDSVYKMDYHDLLDYHIKKGADITIVTKDATGTTNDPHDFGVVEYDSDMRLTSFEEKPLEPKSNNISLGTYIIQRSLLIKLLEAAVPNGQYDFVEDIILRNAKELNVFAYQFNGYWNTLNSVKAYMDTNMAFLRDKARNMLIEEPYILTKPSDDPPAKYNNGSDVKNSLVGTGTIINGAVHNSVLFRKVVIGEGAKINNSIIMKESTIGKNCVIENAIIDKEVIVSDGKKTHWYTRRACRYFKGRGYLIQGLQFLYR
jgi:glucose-1-phosphate adenylyltransferase